MSCSETSRFEMSSSALVPASTTYTGDVAAVDQGLPIQSLCEVCERIFAYGCDLSWRRSEGRAIKDFQAAASRGCGICKLVIRSRIYKDEEWCTLFKDPIDTCFWKTVDGTSLLDFRDDKSTHPFGLTVRLRLLEPQETSRLKPRWLPPSSLGTESLESFNKITQWLTTCISSHAGCTKPNTQPSVLPVRMLEIDLDGCEPIESIRLRCDVRPTRYATLSYCWGPDLRIIPRLLRKNFAERLQNIMLDTLPRTFIDAVVCAHRLGIEYLWIDSLCIIQDSERDWLQQSAMMASIYSNALVNFAATAFSSCDGGLFRSRSQSDVNPCIVNPHFKENPEFLYHCVESDAVWQDVEDGILNTRGWTFQETLLAPRTLHFSETQVYWQCESLCASEIYVDGLLDTSPINGKSQLKSAGDNWWPIVKEYTSRTLTHETEDKLVALSGVARRVAMNDHLKDDEYLAGIWRHDLPCGLFWLSIPGGLPLHNDVPSWSWASISGNVVIWSTMSDRQEARGAFNVLAAHVSLKADSYGQVRGGSIRLSTYNFGKGGFLIMDKDRDPLGGQGCYFRTSGVPDSVRKDLYCWLDVSDSRKLSDLSDIYYCFFKHRAPGDGCVGLFLEKTGAGMFKRIGIFDNPGTNFPFGRLDIDDYEHLDESGRYTFSIV